MPNEDTNPNPPVQDVPSDPLEIYNSSLEDILSSDNGEGWGENAENQNQAEPSNPQPETPPIQPTTPEPPVQTPTVETPPVVEPPQPVAPVIDTNEIVKGVVEALSPAQTPDEQDTTEKMIEDQMKDAPWVKENRNPTYQEIVTWTAKAASPLIKDQIKKDLEQEVADEEKAAQEKQQQAEQAQQETNQRYANAWTGQLNELTSSGKIPAVQDPKNPNDPGVKARVDLMKMLKEGYESAIAEGKVPTEDLRVVYYEKYLPEHPVLPQGQTVPGADAPVYGAGQTATSSGSETYTYDEIHNSSIESILTGK